MFDPLIFMILAYILYLILSRTERKEQREKLKQYEMKARMQREKEQRAKEQPQNNKDGDAK